MSKTRRVARVRLRQLRLVLFVVELRLPDHINKKPTTEELVCQRSYKIAL